MNQRKRGLTLLLLGIWWLYALPAAAVVINGETVEWRSPDTFPVRTEQAHFFVKLDHNLLPGERERFTRDGWELLTYLGQRCWTVVRRDQGNLPRDLVAGWFVPGPAQKLDTRLLRGEFGSWSQVTEKTRGFWVCFYADVDPEKAEKLLRTGERNCIPGPPGRRPGWWRRHLKSCRNWHGSMPYAGSRKWHRPFPWSTTGRGNG